MLLYIYGPLDQAPSWRYRDADDGKSKTSPSKTGDDNVSTSMLEHLQKTLTDFGDRVKTTAGSNNNREKEQKEDQLSSELVVHQARPKQNQEILWRPSDNGHHPDESKLTHGMEKTEVSCGVDTNTPTTPSVVDSGAGQLKSIPGNSSLQEPQDHCSPVMQVGLASDTVCEVLSPFPQNLPKDAGENSKESSTPSDSLSSEPIKMVNKDYCPSINYRNEGAGTKGQSGNELQGPREGSSAAEVKVTGEGEMESRSHTEEAEVAGPLEWSHGRSVKSGDGAVVQVGGDQEFGVYDGDYFV